MLITRSNYERIYRTVNSIVVSEGADPSVACIFFSAFGSYILERHFRIAAQPKAGLAAYHLGSDEVLVFGEQNGRVLTGEGNGFHCWVEADGWLIDFMAPAFSQIGEKMGQSIPSKMFQKPLSSMSPSINDFKRPGDFYVVSTKETTIKHISVIMEKQVYGDLAEIAVQWFKKSPKKMIQSFPVADQSGRIKKVSLDGASLTGTW